MTSQQSSIDYILDQMSLSGVVSARQVFGGHVIYCNGKVVSLVGDDQLYVKITSAGQAFLGACPEGAAYPGAKACFIISAEILDDAEFLSELVRITAAQMSMSKKRASQKLS